MTRHHARAARRERQAARTLCTHRVHRQRGQRAPDVEPVHLPCGLVLSVEVKTRARTPAVLRRAMAQALSYLPSATPAVVFSETGGQALVVLPLAAFAQIAGIEPVQLPQQPALPLGKGRAA